MLGDATAGTGIRLSGWLITGSEVALEGYLAAGFDLVTVDCQHGFLDETAVARLLRARPAKTIMVRVSDGRAAPITKVLDAGAAGVIVPSVESPEQAAAAVAACRYPPLGERSYALMRTDLGPDPDQIAAAVACWAMVETRDGLEQVERICAVDGLAGIFVGPADLSLTLGLPLAGAFHTDQLAPAFARIRAACQRYGLRLGAHAVDPASAARWAGYGCDYVTVGNEVALARQASSVLLAELTAAIAVA